MEPMTSTQTTTPGTYWNQGLQPSTAVSQLFLDDVSNESPSVNQSSSISLSTLPSFIENHFRDNKVAWFDVEQQSCTHYAIDNYICEIRNDSFFQVDCGQDNVAFIANWTQAIKTNYPEMQTCLVPNYLKIISEKNAVCVVKNVKMEHLPFLKNLINNSDFKWIIFSDRRLHSISTTILFDRISAQSMIDNENSCNRLLDNFSSPGCFATHPLLLSIAIAIEKDYGENWSTWIANASISNFFALTISFIKEKNIDLHFEQILLLSSYPIKLDFLLDQESLKPFLRYKIISPLENEYAIVPRKIQQDMERLSTKTIDEEAIIAQALQIQRYLKTMDATNNWIIPHVMHLFKVHQKICPNTMVFSLFSVMASIGHLYTLSDDKEKVGARASKEISVLARNAIEKIVSEKLCQNAFLTMQPKDLIDQMELITPTLAHLYVYLQYQIGRVHFYTKNPHEALGSKNILKYAKNLAEHLEYSGKKTLLLKLIDRNGLLFHENEEKNFKLAASGYQSLIKDNESLIDIRYPSNQLVPFETTDPIFQLTCLEYIIKNHIYAEDIEDSAEFVEKLAKLCESFQGKRLFRPYQILVESHIALKQFDEAISYLNKLKEMDGLTLLNKLEIIELQINYELNHSSGSQNASKLEKLATKYRVLASGYYPKESYRCYQFLHYEIPQIPTPYPKLLDFDSSEKLKEAIFEYNPKIKQLTITSKEPQKKLPESPFKFLKIVSNIHRNSRASSKPSFSVLNYSQRTKIEHRFVCGENELILGDRMYRFVNKRGELPLLLQALEDTKTFYASLFGAAHGYRMSLKGRVFPTTTLVDHEKICMETFQKVYSTNEWTQFAESYFVQKRKYFKVKKLVDCQLSENELVMVVDQLSRDSIFTKACPITRASPSNYQDHIDDLTFPSFSAFAYHTLKHPINELPLFEKTAGICNFNFKQFEQNGLDYLEATRKIIRNPSWISKVPDQYEENITDYAFYVWKQANPEHLEEILEKQQDVFLKEQEISALEIELFNARYAICRGEEEENQEKKNKEKLNYLKMRRDELTTHLDKLLTKTLQNVPTTMAVVRVEENEAETKMLIKSSFDTPLNLKSARKGKLQSSSSSITNLSKTGEL